jgi:hypothetical protein
MTPEQAQELEKQVKASPDVRDKVWKLMRFYQRNVDMKGVIGLDLWLIENRPEQGSWSIDPAWDAAAYAKGKQMWLAHVKKPGASPAVYRNAAAYLEGGDKPLAEEILLAGVKAHPQEKWTDALAQHYAQVILGSRGPKAEYNVLRDRRAELTRTEYAKQVRAKLEQSQDAVLLVRTAQYLWRLQPFVRDDPNPLGFDVLALAESYTNRALTLQPEMPEVKRTQYELQMMRLTKHVSELKKLPAEQRSGLSLPDRLLLDTSELRMPSSGNTTEDMEKKANALLELARTAPQESMAGNMAIVSANLTLGKIAMRRGDRKTALHHLMAIADVSQGPREVVDMNLPRALVDAGEREGVARYLDRMSTKLDGGPERAQQLKEWAAQIRKGINPDLTPTLSVRGCTRGPC